MIVRNSKPVTVYLVTNNINAKLYVGITEEKPEVRWRGHVRDAFGTGHKPYKFSRALRKHGAAAFTMHVLGVVPNRDEANAAERQLIALLDARRDGYNSTDGGDGVNGLEPWNKGKRYPARLQGYNKGKNKGQVPWSKGKRFFCGGGRELLPEEVAENEAHRRWLIEFREVRRRWRASRDRRAAAYRQSPEHRAVVVAKQVAGTVAKNTGAARYKTEAFRAAVSAGMLREKTPEERAKAERKNAYKRERRRRLNGSLKP